MITTDHHFIIGCDHKICEDYSISGKVKNIHDSYNKEFNYYAIVCDGCSASPNVDVGARLVALSAERLLSLGGYNMSYDLFQKSLIFNLSRIGQYLCLPQESFDSTLLITWIDEKDNTFKTFIYGDGIFFHKKSNKSTLSIFRVDFKSNCPAYPSYYLDEQRLEEYNKFNNDFGNDKQMVYNLYDEGEGKILLDNSISEMKSFQPIEFKGEVEKGDIIGVISDGVNSFRKNDDTIINWEDVVKEMVDFKSTVGVFVERRLKFLERQWAKNMIKHSDDISMSAILIL